MPPRRFETLPFSHLVENIRARLKRQRASRQPAYTLLLGAGFSVPLVPTAGSMVKKDIAWWLYRREHGTEGRFPDRPALHAELQAFELDLWRELRERCDRAFDLDADGLPDLATASGLGIAYQSIMSARCPRGLADPQARREYLRDVVDRVGNRINGAHLYLAGILGAQEVWGLRAPFCRTIFTTNFDPLLQRSLQLVQKLYFMTDRPEVLDAPADDEQEAIHLVYSHGSVHRYLLLNTEREIEMARATNATRLVPYFQSHGVIVMGYSGWRDATMAALRQCPSFSGNLYWCGVHEPEEAEQRLGEDALALLEEKRGTAFYVHIPGGADEAMLELHRGLGLGDAPALLLDPLPQLVKTLESVNLTGITRDAGRASRLLDTVEQVRQRTITRLGAAKQVFDEPGLLVAGAAASESTSAGEVAGAALVAQKMNDALAAARSGELDRAIALWTEVVEDPQAPPKERASALFNRGITYGEKGDAEREIADYTAVIDMADAPAAQRAWALYNRGFCYGQRGDVEREIADYTAILAMPDIPSDLRATTLYNRGFIYGQKGDDDRAIADYTAVIDMPDAPADERAKALNNRGISYDQKGDPEREIADYTAVIEMSNAPPDQRALALNHRGASFGQRGETEREIADYTVVIEMADAPADQRAKALNNRGNSYDQKGDADRAVADHIAVLQMAGAPAEQRAEALASRGWSLFKGQPADVAGLIGASEAALEIDPALTWVRFNLALGRLLIGEESRARTEYEEAARRCDSAAEVHVNGIADLEEAIRERGPVPGAEEILALLRARAEELGRAA